MINRRTILAGIGAGTALSATALSGARAQNFRDAYPELVLAVIPSENASGVTDRWTRGYFDPDDLHCVDRLLFA